MRECCSYFISNQIVLFIIPQIFVPSSGICQLRSGLESHIAENNGTTGIEMLHQLGNERLLLVCSQMMDGVSADDPVKRGPHLRRKSFAKIPLNEMGLWHLLPGNFQHPDRKINAGYIVPVLIQPTGQITCTKANVQYRAYLLPDDVIHSVKYIFVGSERIFIALLTQLHILIVSVSPQIEAFLVQHAVTPRHNSHRSRKKPSSQPLFLFP